MTFTVRDFHDMVEILESEPTWRQEMRRLLLSEDILTLPQFVRELAESNRKFEEHVENRFDRVESDTSQLKTDVTQLKTDVGKLTGRDLERMVRERPFVYLSRFALRVRIVDESELATILEDALEAGTLSEEEMEDAKLIDVVARGRRREDGLTVLLTCEVSSVVNEYDLDRAFRRGQLIRKATGQEVLPVVLGETINERTRQLADTKQTGWVVIRPQN